MLEEHFLPRTEAKISHGKSVRADPFTLSAQGARIDHPVGESRSLDDRKIIVDLPGVFLGIPLVMLQKFAVLYAFHAFAEKTSACFRCRFFGGISSC